MDLSYQSVIGWLKRRWVWVVTSTLAVILAAWGWQRRRTLSAEARIRVAELQRSVDGDEREREILLRAARVDSAAVERIDRKLDQTRQIILAHHEDVGGLSRAQIRERLARLGYR